MDGEARQAADTARLDALGLLQEPVRAALYRWVAAAGAEVSRNDAAEAVGVGRTLAAFHLDKLADAGLLEVSYRRTGGRTGRGAGRPAKHYRRAAREVSASVPPREYETAARLLAETVDQSGAERLLNRNARRFGATAGRAARGGASGEDPAARIVRALTDRGYEPYLEQQLDHLERHLDQQTVRLRNCPFHRLVEEHPGMVCGMNLAMLEGLLDGLGVAPAATARMTARPGHCCVEIDTSDRSNNNQD